MLFQEKTTEFQRKNSGFPGSNRQKREAASGVFSRRRLLFLESMRGKRKSVALSVDGLFAFQIKGIVGVGHQALLVGFHALGEDLEVGLGEAAVPQRTQRR